MATADAEHVYRIENIIARLRIAVILLAGADSLRAAADPFGDPFMIGIWAVALAYAGAILLFEPYRRTVLVVWDMASACLDWGLITIGIVLTGAQGSALYLLYFLAVLSRALRFGFREVVVAGICTAAGYCAVVMMTSDDWTVALPDAGFRMGYLVIFAIASGLLAREVNRHFSARLDAEARRLAANEVTATISHDLMNPLAAIGGLAEMLLGAEADRLSLDQQAMLHRINANTQQMTNLVSNLLDAEVIQRGRQSFQPTPVDLNAVVRRVVEAQAHQAEMKHIGLVLDLGDRLPVVMLDGPMIGRLVANLLGNAVKFTPENGAIRVSTRQRGARLAVEVWDSGPDVPAALRPVLFEKFARQQDSPGVGLGLYICKSIVDAHGGEIFVHTVADGVAFVAEVPIARVARPAPLDADAPTHGTPARAPLRPPARLRVVGG